MLNYQNRELRVGVVGSVNPIAKSCNWSVPYVGSPLLANHNERFAIGRESRSRLKKAHFDTVSYDRIETIAMIKY